MRPPSWGRRSSLFSRCSHASWSMHLRPLDVYLICKLLMTMIPTLVENRAFILSSKWHLHRLAYEPRLKGFFSTDSSCQRAKWSPWSSSTGSLGTISTGSCHEPVLKVSRLPHGRRQTFGTGSWHESVLKATLLHQFWTQTSARDPAYKYSRPPAFSSIFFSFGRCERGCASLIFSPMHKRCLMKYLRAWTNLSSHKIKMIWGARVILRSCPHSFLLDRG
jgi:hypothetical protein